MIINSYDNETEEIITPEKVYGKREPLGEFCIITFSITTLNEILHTYPCNEVAHMATANGPIPIYSMEYSGRTILFYMTCIGAASAGTLIDEARQLTGASKFIMFGTAGCLNREVVAGKVIVPTRAYRDEGLSYHYAPPSDYITIKNADIVASILESLHVPCVKGATWTTDAIYRETRGNMQKRKEEGCIAVEMECAAVQAVCDFRGIDFYNFLISGDLLDCESWDPRILGANGEHKEQLRCFYLALQIALQIA